MRSARNLNSVRSSVGDKREAILRAATSVFARNGYFNSKVADIASEAGVADGTVYLYFKSKEEILHSIFDRSVDQAVADARDQLEEIDNPREKLRHIALLHLIQVLPGHLPWGRRPLLLSLLPSSTARQPQNSMLCPHRCWIQLTHRLGSCKCSEHISRATAR